MDVRWKFLAVSLSFATLSLLNGSKAVDILPSSVSLSITDSFASTKTSAPPTTPMPTEEDDEGSFVDNNLGLIIGVPTGLGISIIGFIACFIYCGVTAVYQRYHDNRDSRPPGSADYTRGTASTGVRSNAYTTNGPSSSGYQPSAFEPSADITDNQQATQTTSSV